MSVIKEYQYMLLFEVNSRDPDFQQQRLVEVMLGPFSGRWHWESPVATALLVSEDVEHAENRTLGDVLHTQ